MSVKPHRKDCNTTNANRRLWYRISLWAFLIFWKVLSKLFFTCGRIDDLERTFPNAGISHGTGFKSPGATLNKIPNNKFGLSYFICARDYVPYKSLSYQVGSIPYFPHTLTLDPHGSEHGEGKDTDLGTS